MSEAKPSRLDLWNRIRSLIPTDEGGVAGEGMEGGAPDPEAELKKQTEERQQQADATLTEFVTGALGSGPKPSWRLPKPQDHQALEDRAKMREAMAENWAAIESKVRAATTKPDAAHDYVWTVYTRQRTPHKLEDLIFVYLMADVAYQSVQNKIDEKGYFEYFFSKIAHLNIQLRDKYDNTLLHYVLALQSSKSQRVVNALESMTRAAKHSAKEAGIDEKAEDKSIPEADRAATLDDRRVVNKLFTETRNVVNESVMDLIVRFGQRQHLKAAEAIIAGLFSPDEEPIPGCNTQGTGIDRVQGVQEKPYNSGDLDALIQGGDKNAQAVYVRLFADNITPDQMEGIAKEHGIDLFSVDLAEVTLSQQQQRGINKKSAFVPGALNNVYAKQGIFNIEFARKKLVKDDGKTRQGHRDERGYNTYMQMAATKNIPAAFLANEHEFWDSIFTRIAKFQMEGDAEKRDLKFHYTRVARDILDTPGDDGKTALHLAAINGNDSVVRFILEKVLDFSAAERLREAVDHRIAKELLQRRRQYLEEMRVNLGYLTGADFENHNPWTYAVLNGNKTVLMAMVGRLEKTPEYLEIVAMLPVYAKIPGVYFTPKEQQGIPLSEWVLKVPPLNSQEGQETMRYFKGILRDAESRTQMRREQGRNVGKQSLL